jgi:hypothetical protein
VKRLTSLCAATVGLALLTACGGGSNNGAVPSSSQANLSTNKLQVAVGTAYNAADGSTGLNVVETFRQSNGLSAVLVNTPSITGPTGFTVPAATFATGAYGTGNTDAGTASITGSPQVNVNTAAANTTLGTFTGAFSYGLAPLNSDEQGAEGYYPGNPNATPAWGFTSSAYYANAVGAAPPWLPASGTLPWWPQPFGAAATDQGLYLLGSPAVPFFSNGTFPGGFAGYSPGFTAFEITPVAGTYTLTVKVATSNAGSPSFTATGALTSVTPLAAPTTTVTEVTGGGLTGTLTGGTGVTESVVFIEDVTSGMYYSVEVTGASGTWTLPATLGACNGSGCQNSASTQEPSIATGDTYVVTPISFDYPALEDGPPGNTSQTPTLVGTAGQADLSIGTSTPAGAQTYAKKRNTFKFSLPTKKPMTVIRR